MVKQDHAKVSTATESSEPESELTPGETFLSAVLAKGFELGELLPGVFMDERHFPPAVIMEALRNSPTSRAKILIASGMFSEDREKTAMRRSPERAADDLFLALGRDLPEEDRSEKSRDTDEQTVLDAFPMDARVRALDRERLWAFVTESGFWKFWPQTSEDHEQFVRAQRLVAFTITCAVENGLVTHNEVIDALDMHEIVQLLPKELVGQALVAAVELDKKFTKRALLSVWTPVILVQHIPPTPLWEKVVSVVEMRYHLTETAVADVTPDTEPRAVPLKTDDVSAPGPVPDVVMDEDWEALVASVRPPPHPTNKIPDATPVELDRRDEVPDEAPVITTQEVELRPSFFPPESGEDDELTKIATRPDGLPSFGSSPPHIPTSEFDAAREASSLPSAPEEGSEGVSVVELERKDFLNQLGTVGMEPLDPISLNYQTLKDLVTVFCEKRWIEGDETREWHVMTEALMALDHGALPSPTKKIGLTTQTIAMTFDQALRKRYPGLSEILRTSVAYKSLVAPALPGLGRVALPPKRKGKGPPPLPGAKK
jgi:hypothetical protein